MLTAQESAATLKILEQICQHLDITRAGEEAQELASATDVAELAKTLDERLALAR